MQPLRFIIQYQSILKLQDDDVLFQKAIELDIPLRSNWSKDNPYSLYQELKTIQLKEKFINPTIVTRLTHPNDERKDSYTDFFLDFEVLRKRAEHKKFVFADLPQGVQADTLTKLFEGLEKRMKGPT